MPDIITGILGEPRAIDIHVKSGMPGPPGPQGPQGAEGPAGPTGPEGRVTTIVGMFGLVTSPADLPPDGLIPADWDGPGRPENDLQMLVGQGLVFQPFDPDPQAGDVFVFTGADWVSIGPVTGPPGAEGPQGVPGPAGPQGSVGPPGPQGLQGVPGSQGAAGPAGPAGLPGSAGPQGGIGPAGPRGDPGVQGPQGDQGGQGPQGVPGPPSFPDAPPGQTYGRLNDGWVPVLPMTGGTLLGGLTVSGEALWLEAARAKGTLTLEVEPTQPDHAVTKRYADGLPPDLTPYLRLDGGQMLGPLALAADPTTPTQAATKRYADSLVPDLSPYLRLDGGQMLGPLLLAADPVSADQAATKRYADSLVPPPPDLTPYLAKAGGQMDGTLITARGTSVTDPGLAIGDNSTGFFRTGNVVVVGISGEVVMQWFYNQMMVAVPISMVNQKITALGMPTAPQDAATKSYVDTQQRSPALLYNVPIDFPLPETGEWLNLDVRAYPIQRGGISRIMVSLSANVKLTGSGGPNGQGIVLAAARIMGNPERRVWIYGMQLISGERTATGFTVNLYADVTGFNPVVTIQLRLVDGGSAAPLQPVSITGGDASVADRSQYMIMDLGPAT
jgi:hypothetical protein